MRSDIDRLQRRGAEQPGLLSLAGGLPDPALFPRADLEQACAAALEAPVCGALQYGWPEGTPTLRRWIAERLNERGAHLTEDDVIVTSGAQQALSIAIALTVAPNDPVRVDRASYPSALDALRSAGARICTHSAPDAMAYVMPGVSNPVGRDLVEPSALAASRWIVADEAYAELRFDGRLPPLLLATARDRTFHVGTFSKTLCPGLRVGFLVPPPSRHADALALKQERDLQAPSLSQSMLERVLDGGRYDALLQTARRTYRERAERLVAALGRHLPSARFALPEGGFSVLVETDVPGDAIELLETAIEHGVSFDPGAPFFAESVPSTLTFRLCHSNLPATQIDEAVRRLSHAISTHRGTARLAS